MDNGSNSYRRYCEGDEKGLVEIIKEYKDGLIIYINGYVDNIVIAEELVEDTFVHIGIKKPRDKGKSSFKTWLYTIARNITIDYLRKNTKRKVKEICIDECDEISNAEEELELSVIRDENRIIVHRALKKLNPQYRQVLLLAYFEEFSNREISKIMKKSIHSIETLVYRARKSLKEQLEKEGFYYEKL